MNKVNLRNYDNSWYDPGRSSAWRAAWLFIGLPLLQCNWITASTLRVRLLRFFGAQIGNRVVMRHGITIKYPWHLKVGSDCWFGESCWIDNLVTVSVADNVCISQGAYLCTGNHDWSDPNFGLIVAPISLEEGAWAGAKCILAPGTRLGVGAVIGAGSVVSGIIPDFSVYSGNPAVFVKQRSIRIPDESQSASIELLPEVSISQNLDDRLLV